MSLSKPGPDSINFSYTGQDGQSVSDMYGRRDVLVNRHSEHKARVDTATSVANGDWYDMWPELTNHPEGPTVANIVEMGINHWASVGGAVLPSVRVPVDVSQDRSQARRGARKRERRLREIVKSSNLPELAAQYWADYAGAGNVLMGAWCEFNKPIDKRNPYLVRYDPRHTYPVTDTQGNVTELLVARTVPKIELARMYPDEVSETFASSTDSVEEWFWYMPDKFYHILADVSADGRKKQRYVVVSVADNPLGFVPVVEIVRPTFDGQRRGVFDQTIHILRTMHRLMVLTIASTEEQVFPPLVEYDAINPEDFGPGGVVSLRSPEGRMERAGPVSHFDVKDLIGTLQGSARDQAAFPQQLSGEPGASIASARAITASMGNLDARLALAHRQFELALGKAYGYLLAMDETFCDTDRTVVGDHRDAGQKAESWKPSRDINGAWVAEATYGIGAGSDPANVEIRLSMHLANGVISQETYRQQLPFLEDPDREPVLILREQMKQALVTGILEQAAQGQVEGAAKALELLAKDNSSYDEVMKKLVEFLAPPEPEQSMGMGGQLGGGDALDALQGAESMARGGIPGSAEQAPDPMGGALPPLGDMLGQDARMVV